MPVVNPRGGTMAVGFDPSSPTVISNQSSTIVLQDTIAGSTAGVSASGVTLISPESSRNIKIYAFSLTTTGIVSVTAKFTNGSGSSPVNKWEVALQSPSGASSGANLAVSPPSYLFAMGSNTTLALRLDSATLVHYSVGFFKESG